MRKPPHQKESLRKSKQRRLNLEILESRILYSGAPAPSPVPEPSVQQQEVDESEFSEPAVPQDESTDTADPVALEPTPDSEDTSLEPVGLVNSDSVLTPEALTEMVNAATLRTLMEMR